MGLTVGNVVELVGPDRTVRLGLAQSFGQAARIAHIVVRVAVRCRRDLHKLGARKPQHVLLFLALGFRYHDDTTESHRRADQRQPDPGVSRRALDNGSAGFQQTLRHGVPDDIECCPVLDRLAGVHELGLAKDRAAGDLGRFPKFQKRRVPDRIGKITVNVHLAVLRRALKV